MLCAAVVAAAASGCAFRMSVQQGNMIEMEDLEQVREGMTRSQVQFLLGTPLISDPFHAERWDYTYFFRQGRKRQVSRYWVTIYFEDDRVARIETHIPPRDTTPVPVPEPDPDPQPVEQTEVASNGDRTR
ncbi:MAG TPA: outer membrane protein assembly factor BamE [Gammaproteobacteria bacterium]